VHQRTRALVTLLILFSAALLSACGTTRSAVAPRPVGTPSASPEGAASGAHTMLGMVQSTSLMQTLQGIIAQIQTSASRARAPRSASTCSNDSEVVDPGPSNLQDDVTYSYFYDSACVHPSLVVDLAENVTASGSLVNATGTIAHYTAGGSVSAVQNIAIETEQNKTGQEGSLGDEIFSAQIADAHGNEMQTTCDLNSGSLWYCGAAFIAHTFAVFPFAQIGASIGPTPVKIVTVPGLSTYSTTNAPVSTAGVLTFDSGASLSILQPGGPPETYALDGFDYLTSGTITIVVEFGPGQSLLSLAINAANPSRDEAASLAGNNTSGFTGVVVSGVSSAHPTTVATITLDGGGNGTITELPSANFSGFTLQVVGFTPST